MILFNELKLQVFFRNPKHNSILHNVYWPKKRALLSKLPHISESGYFRHTAKITSCNKQQPPRVHQQRGRNLTAAEFLFIHDSRPPSPAHIVLPNWLASLKRTLRRESSHYTGINLFNLIHFLVHQSWSSPLTYWIGRWRIIGEN